MSGRRPNKDPYLQHHQMMVLYGTLLGDAALTQTKTSTNPFLEIYHGVDQTQYLLWKVGVLWPLFAGRELYERKVCGQTVAKRFRSKTYPFLRLLKEQLYGRAVSAPGLLDKRISRSFLDRLDDQAIAVWFGDDGSLTGGQLCLYLGAITRDEALVVQDWLSDRRIPTRYSRWDNVHKLVFAEPGALVLRLKPFMPKCMHYKFGEF